MTATTAPVVYNDRFTPPDDNDDRRTMMAVVTMGNGGYEQLAYRRVRIPQPAAGEVLLQVLAAGMNNTEINTRLGWYSSSVTQSTNATSQETTTAAADHQKQEVVPDGGWNEATPFPLIQGTDCCGRVVQAGPGVDASQWDGQRVLVRACMRGPDGFQSMHNVWMASDFDGAFAQYVTVPVSEIFAVKASWTDAELATIPCAYGSAENMVHRAQVTSRDVVLVTGASGGVGSATVQLVKRRGAKVIAVVGAAKMEAVSALTGEGDRVVERTADLVQELGTESVSVVIDNVAGEAAFPSLLKVLLRGGRYASSGAIAGPIVPLDLRDMYLKDITLIGCTAWDEPVFPNLIGYIERGEIRPLLAQTFALSDICQAQAQFLQKAHVGKFVLLPPQSDPSEKDF